MARLTNRSILLIVAFVSLGASPARGAVVFQNLGTGAPTGAVGPTAVTAFDVAQQAAIANFTDVTVIPGSPISGSLTSSVSLSKRTVPSGGWGSWSHGYTGPVFFTGVAATCTLTLPPGTTAFGFYAEPNNLSPTIEAVTNDGTTSGPIVVNFSSGATGFGFYTTAGETISTVTITKGGAADGFAIGEFSIAGAATAQVIPALGPWGLALSALSVLAAGLLALRGRVLHS